MCRGHRRLGQCPNFGAFYYLITSLTNWESSKITPNCFLGFPKTIMGSWQSFTMLVVDAAKNDDLYLWKNFGECRDISPGWNHIMTLLPLSCNSTQPKKQIRAYGLHQLEYQNFEYILWLEYIMTGLNRNNILPQ